MASGTKITGAVMYDTLVNYLVSMSRTVEGAMNRALDALVNMEGPRTADLPGEVFLLEPRINEMEVVIDEHAIRLLRRSTFNDDEMRLIVAALKITNDLERIGDLAVNLAQCVISLREMPKIAPIEELGPMVAAVRSMVGKCLGALIFKNVDMALLVLESDDAVDQYRDRIFQELLGRMVNEPANVGPGLQYVLATRHLERIADHATNICEDVIFWVRGLDVRHGRGLGATAGVSNGRNAAVGDGAMESFPSASDGGPAGESAAEEISADAGLASAARVTENSYERHANSEVGLRD